MAIDTDAMSSALKDAVSSVLDQARNPPMPQTSHQHVTIHHADPPAPPAPAPWHAWICATAAVVGLLVGVGGLTTANDARAEVRALRVEVSNKLEIARLAHEADVRELRQKDGALQAYINAGKVPALTKGK